MNEYDLLHHIEAQLSNSKGYHMLNPKIFFKYKPSEW